jgi:hypothetical protein
MQRSQMNLPLAQLLQLDNRQVSMQIQQTGFLGYTSQAAAGAVYGSSLGFARNIVVSPGQWTNIMGYNDNGAPLYNAAQPSNAAGNVTRRFIARCSFTGPQSLMYHAQLVTLVQQHRPEISQWLLLIQMHGHGTKITTLYITHQHQQRWNH